MEEGKKYILVTGGTGYIGSITSMYLLKNSDFMPVVIDLDTNKKSTKVLEAAGIPVFKGNIADPEVVNEIHKKFPFKFVMHFAAFIEAGESVNNPEKYHENNVKNFETLLNTVKPLGISAFVFSSSAAVYGTHEKPIDEEASKNPVSPYGETKLNGEILLEKFAKENGIKATSLRYFNASGANEEGLLGEDHEPESHLIPRIIKAIQNKQPVQIFGSDYPTKDGTCIRDYIHVVDLADGHLKALEYTVKKTEPGHEAFNLGTGSGYSILEVIKALEGVIGSQIEKNFKDRRPGDPALLVATVKKAKEVLGWTPKYDLQFIIKTAWIYHSKPSV